MTQRTTLVLDDDSRKLLVDLAQVHGSQSAAVREAVVLAHAAMMRDRKRRAFVDDLIAEVGEPTPDDRSWARRVAIDAAAASVEAQQG